MIALREFKYLDQRTQRPVTVERGQQLDEATQTQLRENRVDLDKLARVRFVGQDEAAPVTTAAYPKKKRGRPRKQA